MEYYDFTLFATASALILGPVFFAGLGPVGGQLAAFGTFGVAYVMRPLGAILFGWLGDRIGRVRTLVYTLVLMGTATFAVGLIPSYETIGIAAPILLIALRLLQGLSAGGEQGGSNSLTIEHAPQKRRGLYASWTMQGTSFGTLLSATVFLFIVLLPHDVLLGWAWRIPFLVSAPLTLVALFIRESVDETDAFLMTKRQKLAPKVPLVDVFRFHWRSVLRVVLCSLLAVSGSTVSVYMLGYAANTDKIPVSMILIALIISGVVGLIAQPLWGALSDRIGRRWIFAGTMTLTAILWFPAFALLTVGSLIAIIIIFSVLGAVAGGANAVGASMYTEMFPTRVRYTGVAIGTQLGFIVAGFAPTIEEALATNGRGWIPVAIFAAACSIIAAISAMSGRETSSLALSDIDNVHA
ncbi:MFS transporter [Microbacterium kribbense]|uniref:MFS transporter n=1 Tax=Microbacterium kribbense TaxID=433645 RepID=A0ABP7FZZ1_9MICO